MSKENHHEEEVKQNETAQAAEPQTEKTAEEQELTSEEKLQKELDAANQALEEQKDKYLRLSAEFDNYRKRTMKEKA